MTQKMTNAAFEQIIRNQYAADAETILKAYPHATEAEATRSAKDIFRDSTFAWPTWAWAGLESKNGKKEVFVYYFDHRTPKSPEEANHAAEIPYVFCNLGTMGGSNGPEDKVLSEMIMSYWINFARNGDSNGPGLPVWPAFDEKGQKTMFFAETASVQPQPNIDTIKTFDAYYAKLREQAKSEK
jgi:para-nitrobenzyl esterase